MKRCKPASSRKPPEPSDSHDEIGDWMRSVMPDLQPIVKSLDGLVRETLPELQYAIKWKNAYYGLPDRGWIIEMVAYDVSVNVVFFGGADFDAPPPLGDTDRSRYIKVHDPGGGGATPNARVGRAGRARARLAVGLAAADSPVSVDQPARSSRSLS